MLIKNVMTFSFVADSAFVLPDVSVFFSNYQPNMSEEERYYYLYNLNKHTEKVKTAFAGLVFELQKYLKQTSSVQEVLHSLKPFFQDKAFVEQLNCQKTFMDIFDKIFDYISFFDYEVIKFLIRHLGSKTFKKKLRKYERMFCEYSKRRIVECPDDTFGEMNENTKVLKIKTDKSIEELTVEELKKLQCKISNVLGKKLLHLLRVEEGCVQLMFQPVEQEELVITSEQQQALRNVGVLSITYGKQFIDIEKEKAVTCTIG